MHVVRAGELLGDLEAGVASPDDQHRAGRNVGRGSILAAVELHDVRVQSSSRFGYARALERAGGDHDAAGFVGAVVELDEVAIAAGRTARTALSSSTGRSKSRA